MLSATYARRPCQRSFPGFAVILLGALCLLLAACASPVSVSYADPKVVHRELTSNMLSTGRLSGPTEIVLHLHDLKQRYDADPEGAIRELHTAAVSGDNDPDVMFALAETSFQHAEAIKIAEPTRKRAYYLAATIYALAYLFPDDPAARLSPFDPRFRQACDLYNRSLTLGFAAADRRNVDLRSGSYTLPFGTLDIVFDQASAHWGERDLIHYAPVADLEIQGLDNRYRQPGIGAPLAAETRPRSEEQGFQVARRLKVPVTALLRLDPSHKNLAAGRLRGNLEIHPAYEGTTVAIKGQTVPLEIERSAALAFTLSDPGIWRTEYAGFLQGGLSEQLPTQFAALEPYRRGRFPVIFVHGTASSAGRWANMLNDLQNDPEIADHFQFWFFTYSTGNPVPLSALQLRDAIEDAVKKVDPAGTDPALRRMVVIGHSQGGLLARMLVIRTGDREWAEFSTKPLDQLKVQEDTRTLLRRMLYLEPLPEVRRVVFMATPQKGSFAAEMTLSQWVGRLVTFPVRALKAAGDLLENNTDAIRFGSQGRRFGSIYGMTPGSLLIRWLSLMHITPGVAAHSIIAVQGDGPVETGNDGVVAYQSAHIDDAVSELVVRSSHSVQSNPRAIAEIRRILLLHLKEECGAVAACPPEKPIALATADGRRHR